MRGVPSSLAFTLIVFTAIPSIAQVTGRRGPAGPPPPTPIALEADANGSLSGSVRFQVNLSAAGFPQKEFVINAEAGPMRIVCSWEPDVPLEVSLSGAAGHGLPGRIAMLMRSGPSPMTFDTEVSSEQVSRGPLFLEVRKSHFQQKIQGMVRGTVTVTQSTAEPEELTRDVETAAAMQEGKLLSLFEVQALEERLLKNPDDWKSRIALISYYSSSAHLRMSKAEVIAARRRHILWVIANRPLWEGFWNADFQISSEGPLADPQGARLAAEAWRKALFDYGGDPDVLRNAASSLADSDPAYVEKLLEKQRTQHPEDPRWSSALAWVYTRALQSGTDAMFAEQVRTKLAASTDPNLLDMVATMLGFPSVQPMHKGEPRLERPRRIDVAEQLAVRALSIDAKNPRRLGPLILLFALDARTAPGASEKNAVAERASALFKSYEQLDPTPAERGVLLSGLADLAYEIGNDQAASSFAKQWIGLASSESASLGESGVANAIHDGNDLLGRIALRQGNVAAAKNHLLLAASTPGSSRMAMLGPRMLLAQELLDRGERGVVVEYLQKVKTFWKRAGPVLDEWSQSIQQGKAPKLNRLDWPMLLQPLR